ncbi:hypothetical protein [Amycolatopsis thermoflava]|uniref:hypothetical protein n=1 Tax=Amycolatopsis thermoflava TaxID=84480 RepID=UPI003EB6EEE6
MVRHVIRGALRRTHVVGGLRAASLVVSHVFGLGQVVDAVWRALSVDAKHHGLDQALDGARARPSRR